MTTITLIGNTPSKKSNQIIVKGRTLILPSKRYTEWKKLNMPRLESTYRIFTIKNIAFKFPIVLKMFFYRGTRHRFDYMNVGQSVADLLRDAGVIPDDNMEIIRPIFLGYKYDKDNPRCEIEIEEDVLDFKE